MVNAYTCCKNFRYELAQRNICSCRQLVCIGGRWTALSIFSEKTPPQPVVELCYDDLERAPTFRALHGS